MKNFLAIRANRRDYINPEKMIPSSHLFIIGNARSGTTILAYLLNSSPSVALLYEANIFASNGNANFVRDFNSQHSASKQFPKKGTWLPPSWNGVRPVEVLNRLSESHLFVGEKIAFGPHGLFGLSEPQDAFLDFHYTNYYQAQYLFALRRPSESLLSNAQLFPHRSILDHIRSWLMSLRLVVCGMRLFPKARIIDQSWMGMSLIPVLEEALRIEIAPSISENWFQTDSKRKYSDADKKLKKYTLTQLDAELRDPVLQIMAECEKLYKYFTEQLDRERLQLCALCNPATLDTTVVGPIVELLARLDELPLSESLGWQMISGDGKNMSQGLGKPDTVAQLNYAMKSSFSAPQTLGVSIEKFDTEAWAKSGIEALRTTTGLDIRAQMNQTGSKHVGFYTVIPDRKIYTLTATIRSGTCTKAMIQFGSASDFVKVAVDLSSKTLSNIAGTRGAIPILALITERGDGCFDIQLSALWINTKAEENTGIAVWLYLLSGAGDLEYCVADDYRLNLVDLVLSGASERVVN